MSAPTLKDALHSAVMWRMLAKTRRELPEACDLFKLPAAPDDPALSKRKYVESRLALVDASQVHEVAEAFLFQHGAEMPAADRFRLEEILWTTNAPFTITTKTRYAIVKALEGLPLYLKIDPFIEEVRRYWILEDPFDSLLGTVDPLLKEIDRHVIRNPGDWSVEYLFDKIGAMNCSDRRFAYFIEALVSPSVRPDEEEQRQFAATANAALSGTGLEMRELDLEGGYPVFRFAVTGRTAGRPKNLIFASTSKPDLRFRDAINNDIEIVSNVDQVLVFDRPIPADGLRWRDLQKWWAETNGLDAKAAKDALYKRLLVSLPPESPPQRALFRAFYKEYGPLVHNLPALLPEVWLHWDPKTVRDRGPEALVQHRMDFLLLISHDVRVVVEVDGGHHYSDDGGRGDPTRYAKMARGDRDLRLAGYDVYRFGAAELDAATVDVTVKEFFDRLFRRYGVRGT